MKNKKPDCFPKVLKLLKELKSKYPNWDIARHISCATADYTDIWGIPDQELLYLLTKYKEELAINSPYASDEEVSDIYKDAMNLTAEEEEEDF